MMRVLGSLTIHDRLLYYIVKTTDILYTKDPQENININVETSAHGCFTYFLLSELNHKN